MIENSNRLDEAIARYLQQVETGTQPDVQSFLTEFPDIKSDLESFIADYGKMQFAVAESKSVLRSPSLNLAANTRADLIAAPLPRVFGDYELLELIACGGMGVVYKARQCSMDRIVAVKMILAGRLASEEDVQRFHREAKAAGRLDHAAIVPVYEIGTHDGQHFFSMAIVDGGSLADRIRNGPLDEQTAADYALTVADAIAYAHRSGVIHRDIKPSNILMDRDHCLRITDFGLASHHGDAGGLTVTGQVLGTPAYMPPEQASGSVNRIGTQADVYAIGAVLYALLTGRPPFQTSHPVETLRQVISEEPIAPCQLNGRISRDLETICLKCLSKDPLARYADADALAEDLRRFLAGEAILARRVGPLGRLGKWAKRYPTAAALVVVLLLSTMASVSLAIWGFAERGAALSARNSLKAALTRSDRNRTIAERQSAEALYAQALSICLQDGPEVGVLRLARSLRAAMDVNDKQLETSIRRQLGAWRPQLRALRLVLAHPSSVYSATFSPDGKLLLTGCQDWAQIWNSETGRPVGSRLPHPSYVYSVAFSPDGHLVLTGCRDGIARIWDMATGKVVTSTGKHRSRVLSVAFSPDGQCLLTGSEDGTAQRWDAHSGQPLGAPFRHGDVVRSAAFSPGGDMVITGGDDRTAKLWDVSTGKLLKPPITHTRAVFSVAFLPDGRSFMTGCRNSRAIRWDVETVEPIGQVLQHYSSVTAIDFSADGKTVLTASDDETARLWDLRTGQPLGRFRHAERVRAAMISPDGKTVLTGAFDFGARVWTTTAPAILENELPIRAVRFEADGKTLLTCGSRTVQRWEAATGALTATLRRHRDWVSLATFSPNGKTLLTAEADGQARLSHAATGKPFGTLRDEASVISATFSPDSKLILTGSSGNTARLWDAATGEPIGPPMEHEKSVFAVAFSPDSRYAVTASADKTAQLWDVTTGQRSGLTMRHQKPLRAVAISPDGQRIATGALGNQVRLWDFHSQMPLDTLHPGGLVRALAFSPDSAILLVGSDDNTAQMWEVATGRRLGPPIKHPSRIESVAFSPDGRQIVIRSSDLTVSIRPVFPAAQGTARQIELWAQVITGMELNETDAARVLDLGEWTLRRQQLTLLTGQNELTD